MLRRCGRVLGRRAAPVRWIHQQTVQTVLAKVRARLAAVGVTGSDARALVATALAEPKPTSSNELLLWMDRQLREEEAQALERMVQRRVAGEPLAYVVGTKEFWSLNFCVTTDTLIPRADSECLIESLTAMYPKSSALRILDLGTGSGALLLSALSEFPQASGVGIDISTGALVVAAENAERLGVSDRAEFIAFDMERLPTIDTMGSSNDARRVSPRAPRFLHQFDVLLCNPPYIPLAEVPLIAPDVLAHEPHGALFAAGPDAWTNRANALLCNDGDPMGLRFYRALRDSVDTLLDATSPLPAAVLVEIGSERQANAVRDLFRDGVATVAFDCFLLDGAGRHRGVVFRSEGSLNM